MLRLTGLSPFMGDNDAETFVNITRADYDLEDEAFDAISNDAKDFISGLLVKRKEYVFVSLQLLVSMCNRDQKIIIRIRKFRATNKKKAASYYR